MSTTTKYPDLSFRIDPVLNEYLENRAREGSSRHQVAKRDLDRYYAILAQERRRLAGVFTLNELLALVDASRNTPFSPTIDYALEISDYVAYGEHEQWGVDGEALVERVRNLTPGQVWALIDALERWRVQGAGQDARDFMQVGLVPAEGI